MIPSYIYAAKVVRIIDGDTIVLDIDLGLSVWRHDLRIRLAGVKAPELRQPGGKESREFLASLCPPASTLTVVTHKDRTEKYGRYLGTLYTNDQPVPINQLIIDAGHALSLPMPTIRTPGSKSPTACQMTGCPSSPTTATTLSSPSNF